MLTAHKGTLMQSFSILCEAEFKPVQSSVVQLQLLGGVCLSHSHFLDRDIMAPHAWETNPFSPVHTLTPDTFIYLQLNKMEAHSELPGKPVFLFKSRGNMIPTTALCNAASGKLRATVCPHHRGLLDTTGMYPPFGHYSSLGHSSSQHRPGWHLWSRRCKSQQVWATQSRCAAGQGLCWLVYKSKAEGKELLNFPLLIKTDTAREVFYTGYKQLNPPPHQQCEDTGL